MKVFVARQPIFDQWQRVIGYELLFRSGEQNFFTHTDGDQASRSVISHTLHVFGLEELTQGRRAFINFTRSLLVQQLATLLPPDKLVVEILETVEPDDEVVGACKALKQAGYALALDDFMFRPGYEPLTSLADIIKVDFLTNKGKQRQAFPKRFLPRGIRLVAERVETREDFNEGIALGYDYFQGYFFCKPELVAREDVPGYKLNYLRFLREVNQPDVDFDRLEQLIKRDVSLSVKLLRYINSAWFGLSHKVSSIRHALVLLGLKGLKQWASLVAVASIGYDKPMELVVTCLLRARFCELLASFSPSIGREADLFLVGLFSALDALVGRPLEELLNEVAVPDEVRDALLGSSNHLNEVYRLVLAYERGDWEAVTALAQSLSLDENLLPELYKQSVQWVNQIMMPESSP